jgi:hypothetical protein
MNEILQAVAELVQTLLNILIVIWLIQTNKRIDGIRTSQGAETPPKEKFKPSKPKEPTPEEIKYSKILANIDAYDGSGKGQTKV